MGNLGYHAAGVFSARAERRPRARDRRASTGGCDCGGVRPSASSRFGDHDRHVVRIDGFGDLHRHPHRQRPRVRQPLHPIDPNDVRGGHSRHAAVAAALCLVLRPLECDSPAGLHRGALEAVSRGQLEAARTLGLTKFQVLRLVRAPQAFRLALAPMTNDFVALLKDSSLVSVITVVELTKQTQIFAANIGSWVIPGAMCAALYLVMSLPLSRLARLLEARWQASTS